MHLFWQRGFRNASLNELARDLGIKKPSLYAAFGNKEQLFLRALERYASGFKAQADEMLDQTPSAREAIRSFLTAVARQLANAESPAGCMIANCAAECRDLSAQIDRELRQCLSASESALHHRLLRARKEGELAPGSDVRALANYFATVMQGMVAMSRVESDLRSFRRTIDLALRALPVARTDATKRGAQRLRFARSATKKAR